MSPRKAPSRLIHLRKVGSPNVQGEPARHIGLRGPTISLQEGPPGGEPEALTPLSV